MSITALIARGVLFAQEVGHRPTAVDMRATMPRTWWCLGAVCLATVLTTASCSRPDRPTSKACASDSDCGDSSVCRLARCRKACHGGFWVGQDVHVTGQQGPRAATVSDCEAIVVSPALASSSRPSTASAVPTGSMSRQKAKTSPRVWVRYSSGMEEQVSVQRIKSEPAPKRQNSP